MNPTNYQAETERVITALAAENRRERLLLHACCAPCSSYVLEYLTATFDITVFYCNPNITDKEEYEHRLAELYKLCEHAQFCRGVQIVDDGYAPGAFFETAKGFEGEPEGGRRCDRCFALRLSRTADYAKANGFPLFATTLTVSPHKMPALSTISVFRNQSGAMSPICPPISRKKAAISVPSCFQKNTGCIVSSSADANFQDR